jgi:hypothetical protein
MIWDVVLGGSLFLFFLYGFSFQEDRKGAIGTGKIQWNWQLQQQMLVNK